MERILVVNKPLASILLALALALAPISPAQALTEEENGAFLSAALSVADRGDWEKAKELAANIDDTVAIDILEWKRLRESNADWEDYLAFLTRNADWPGLKVLRARGEGAMPDHYDPKVVIDYFSVEPPQTGIGVIRLIEALEATGNTKVAEAEAIRAWREFSMTKAERTQLYKQFEDVLKEHNLERLDMLLWRGLAEQAQALYSLVPRGYAKLGAARLALQKRRNGVNALINEVPEKLRSDPGLVFERFNWRARYGLYKEARELILEQSVSAEMLGQPARWADRRRTMARQEMRNGNDKVAYELAARHFLTEGAEYADLEWLAGFIALRKLDDPVLAVKHFKRLKDAVATPISNGRAGYWLGRAYEALGDKQAAADAYRYGAENQTSYYGQLAAERVGVEPDSSLTGSEESPDWRLAAFLDSPVLRAALLFHYTGEWMHTEWFIKHLGESLDRTGLQQLADLSLELGRPSMALRLSKQAAEQGHVLPKTYFPLTELADFKTDLAPELAMSIARRESELDPSVSSPAGALGLMQVMPNTARKMSKDLGLKYSRRNLTEDWEYNARLGSAYLAKQLKDFKGSYVLAFVAYNAGPHRARTWIDRYGDPRNDDVDQVDWVEHIPFRETRNYVMRVMESVYVYRARINGKVPPLTISKDLKAG